MADVSVPNELLGNVVDYIEKASSIFDASSQQSADVSAQAKATLETLKKQGLCAPGSSEQDLLEKLCNPVEALRALDRTAQQVAPPALGEPSVKEAGDSLDDNAAQKFEMALGL